MTKSPSHTRSGRAVEQFLRYTRLGRQLGLGRQLIDDDEFNGDTIVLRGNEVANFGLCSYLGLGDDPRLIDAAIDAVSRYGNSYSSSLAYTALPLYGALRERVEAMLGAPTMIAATTTLAHMSALPVVVRQGDTVAIDANAHASLLSVMPSLQANGAEIHQLPHSDLEKLATLSSDAPGRTWYLFDGLYSMEGATAPAEELRAMLDAHEDLWLYCDDAHSLGWSGQRGRGQFLERAGWHDRIIMAFGLAKSFGTMGGLIASPDEELIELIETSGGPMIFGGPLPPATLGASIASADIHLSDELPGLQGELLERIRFVNEYSEKIGLPLAQREETPLWFCELGGALTVMSVVYSMVDKGYYLNGALFPAVPRNQGGVRFTVTRYNSLAQIEAMLATLNEVRLAHEDGENVIDLAALEDDLTADRT
ncbi:MAG TPA: aminotransferase class I/II-fold pyridoxal phosphate-dependent enzyme [Acidimicrobiia bacterium]|nr:aminotransferase class I/II-fold pyridoxal phosphate-dependent enzyme [Acidimicrobiia bacterium]